MQEEWYTGLSWISWCDNESMSLELSIMTINQGMVMRFYWDLVIDSEVQGSDHDYNKIYNYFMSQIS